MCFANKQTSHLILSGACLLVLNSVSSAPIMCLGSCAIALGPVWLSILCHLIAVAPIGLRAMRLGWYLLEVKNVD